MGRSQAAYDSPRQKLAQSPQGRSSDAAKHDTVVIFFSFFFFLFSSFFWSWQLQHFSSGSEAAFAAQIKCSSLQLCLHLLFLLSPLPIYFPLYNSISVFIFPFCLFLWSLISDFPPTPSCPFSLTSSELIHSSFYSLFLFLGSYSATFFLYMCSVVFSLQFILRSLVILLFCLFSHSPPPSSPILLPPAAGSLSKNLKQTDIQRTMTHR